MQAAFTDAFKRACPEFQTQYGYPIDAPGKANLTTASKQIGHRFDALSLTLEMPFKDCANLPDARVGWSPQRCVRFGAGMLTAVNEVVGLLR